MARCNLQRLLCLPNQQSCLHCYCSHQTLQMYISDIMPPLQDCSHMAVLSSSWWSRIWIFNVAKVNSVCCTLEKEKFGFIAGVLFTCSLVHVYQLYPRGSVDGLMSRGEIYPAITQEAAVNPVGCLNTAPQSCVTCPPFFLTHPPLCLGIFFSVLAPNPFFFTTPPTHCSSEGFFVVGVGVWLRVP